MSASDSELDSLMAADVGDSIVVTASDDPEGWIVRFDKAPGFPAAEWANNVVRLYNTRRATISEVMAVRPGLH